MTAQTILDAGPLFAYYADRDSDHPWAVRELAKLRPPLATCEPVVSEVCFLLKRAKLSPQRILESIRRRGIFIEFSLTNEIDSVRRLMARYEDKGISLADACLVRMSEIHSDCQVMTLDRDFLVYRRDGRRTIPLIAPFPAH